MGDLNLGNDWAEEWWASLEWEFGSRYLDSRMLSIRIGLLRVSRSQEIEGGGASFGGCRSIVWKELISIAMRQAWDPGTVDQTVHI